MLKCTEADALNEEIGDSFGDEVIFSPPLASGLANYVMCTKATRQTPYMKGTLSGCELSSPL